MMHNYYDRPIDIYTDEEIRSLFTFGYGGEWLLSNAMNLKLKMKNINFIQKKANTKNRKG